MCPILQKQEVELLITLKCLSSDLMMTIILSAVQNLSGRFVNKLRALANSSPNEMRWHIYCKIKIQKPLNPPIACSHTVAQSCKTLKNNILHLHLKIPSQPMRGNKENTTTY